MNLSSVKIREESVTLPTYKVEDPDEHPMFLEKRVYQGSSGKVYPIPFYDRVAEKPVDQQWQAIYLENDFIEVMILPEIGGRIHAAKDKTNGYDIFYRQDVIKPALVGLAGPWISGGVEFNWPQHHRPATYEKVQTEIERGEDGSVTVWLSDHDPLQRMKGMHGVCLRPDSSRIELRVRAYNRTSTTQTFLWWANAATEVHEAYQSFFPPDVDYVADHARRSMSRFPLCIESYYGVDYGKRATEGIPKSEVPPAYNPPASGGETPVDYPANDLSFYANIPVPTSYMCIDTDEDFFGGYDHHLKAGLVHVANHHISPGKKQWTWGNHEFGYAWDRSLTEPDDNGNYRPYIELMAGVYTDNQPDFAFLLPDETKTWTQFWYPIQGIGPAEQANEEIALSVEFERGEVSLHFCAAIVEDGAKVTLYKQNEAIASETIDLRPCASNTIHFKTDAVAAKTDLRVIVEDQSGRVVIDYSPKKHEQREVPPAAREPEAPEKIASNDELYLTGKHLEQYRHATRSPLPYWEEAVKRDAGDSRCHTSIGIYRLHRGELDLAVTHLKKAVSRQTMLNANPSDGEAYYHLGLTLRAQGSVDEAYDAFYKSIWNYAWQAAGYHEIASIDCLKQNWQKALEHIDRSLSTNTDNLRARCLKALVLKKLGREDEATDVLDSNLSLDPLDSWTLVLAQKSFKADFQTALDLALDFSKAGFYQEAFDFLNSQSPDRGTEPLKHYYLADLATKLGQDSLSKEHATLAAETDHQYCFPARLEEITILQEAIERSEKDGKAHYYLGNLFYDRRRHEEAIDQWEKAVDLDKDNSIAYRNLGIAYFNISQSPKKAVECYEKALELNCSSSRLIYEYDQLKKRIGIPATQRLEALEAHEDLVSERDDLTVELATLCNNVGKFEKAADLLSNRNFQPWEGGEGLVLGQYVRTFMKLGMRALQSGDTTTALQKFRNALHTPKNLAEAKHLLANQSKLHYLLGITYDALSDGSRATHHLELAANSRGDFQDMSVQPFSEMTYYSALAKDKLGKSSEAKEQMHDLQKYADELENSEAKIDYFATSLPTMLLFDEDLQAKQTITAHFLKAQVTAFLESKDATASKLDAILEKSPHHTDAIDLLQELAWI